MMHEKTPRENASVHFENYSMYVSAVGAAVARDQRPPQREAPRELARAEVRGVHLVNVAAAQ